MAAVAVWSVVGLCHTDSSPRRLQHTGRQLNQRTGQASRRSLDDRAHRGSAVLLLILCLLSVFSASAGTISNSCSDPYWTNTLRCIAHPTLVPQPVLPPPAQASDLRDFTRVMLNADLGIRCLDGTRPVIYVDPAVGGPSSKWLISLTGGGSCNAKDQDHNGTFEDGNECALSYADGNEADEMGTANKPLMKDLGLTIGVSAGILKPSLTVNPEFARYHRIRIEKCSYDRHMGRSTHNVTASPPNRGVNVNYTLFQHGQKILLMALSALRGNGAGQAGLSYETYVSNGAGGVTTQVATLPSIADATAVLFVGHSGGAHGLYFNADRLSEALHAMNGFQGDVRVIHDANFLPSAENEAAFDTTNPAGLFAQRFSGNSADLGFYDAAAYFGNPAPEAEAYYEQMQSWLESPTDSIGTIVDASCVAAHGATGDSFKCRDRLHVRFHHETTPALVREDFQDPNSEHTRGGFGHVLPWGRYDAYTHCGVLGVAPCPPVLSTGPGSPHELRLRTQAQAFTTGFAVSSELATGGDQSGPVPSSFAWLPTCRSHESTYDDIQFFESRLIGGNLSKSLSDFARDFVMAPRTGTHVAWIDGIGGLASECGPRLLANSFE